MNKIVRTIFYSATFLFVLAFAGCKPHEPAEDPTAKMATALAGTWNLINITETRAVTIGSEAVDVYVVFETDTPAATRAAKDQSPTSYTGTFKLYQMLGTGRFRTFRGTWTLTSTLLTGVYSNGTPWGAQYEVTLDDDNTRLSLAAPTETCIYTRINALPAGL